MSCPVTAAACSSVIRQANDVWRYKLIDIGANLIDPIFNGIYRDKRKHDDDFELVLERAKAAGLTKVIVTAGSLDDARRALVLSRKYPNFLYSTVGVHPSQAADFEQYHSDPNTHTIELMSIVKQGSTDHSVVSIGECGLDYDRFKYCTKEVQLRHFERHFEMCEQSGLPLFLHDRNTGGDFTRIMRKNRDRFSNGVVHSFTGSQTDLKALLELDLYIGINGCSLKTQDSLAVAASVPLNRLMIETDAPWCTIRATYAGASYVQSQWTEAKRPKLHQPFSDRDVCVKGRCEPCHIRCVVEVLAALHKVDPEIIAAKAYENTMRVFFPWET